MKYWAGAATVVLSLLGSACSTLGPQTIRTDRFNYNEAGAQSSKEQMLLNIVRLRYGEPLYFLEISSMLSQFSIEAGGTVSSWQSNLDTFGPLLRGAIGGVDGDPTRQTTVGGNLQYSDKPTITYRPLQGEEFSKRVMSPIPPSVVMNLAQSGWSVDRLLGCCVQHINGIPNRPLHDSENADTVDSSKFERLAVILKRIQDHGHPMFANETENGVSEHVLYVPESVPGLEAELREAREILGYPATGRLRLRITPNAVRNAPDELAMQTRSVLGVMYAMAQECSLPEDHTLEGETIAGWQVDMDGGKEWLRIEHSRLPQADPFAQVFFNGYWYYIPKTDWSSKRTFALFTYLFSLQAANMAGESAPLVTVGAGR